MADWEGQKVGVLQGAQTLTPDSTQFLSALYIAYSVKVSW